MANRKQYGFQWSVAANGKSCPQPIKMFVADGYQGQNDGAGFNVDLNPGDPVKLVGTGTVALANTGDAIYGVMVAVLQAFDSSSGQVKPQTRVPGGTTGGGNLDRQTEVSIVPAKWGIWAIDVDDDVTATTQAAYQAFIGENVDHVCAGNVTDPSRPTADPELDISTHAITATLGWRIIGVSDNLSNQFFDEENIELLVRVNISQEAGAAATTVAGV